MLNALAGEKLAPLHPGIDDPEMASQFLVEVPNVSRGEALRDKLLEVDQVVAAYVKPQDEPPGFSDPT